MIWLPIIGVYSLSLKCGTNITITKILAAVWQGMCLTVLLIIILFSLVIKI